MKPLTDLSPDELAKVVDSRECVRLKAGKDVPCHMKPKVKNCPYCAAFSELRARGY